MEYHKQGLIKMRIVKGSDVLEIANFFPKLVSENGGRKEIKINYRDKSSVSLSEKDAFESELLKRKDVESFCFWYCDGNYNKEVKIRIEEESDFFDVTNTYEILSKDENWYNATLAKLEDIISTIPKQPWIRNMLNFPLVILSFILFWVALCGIMIFIFGFEYGIKPHDSEMFISTGVFVFSGSIIFYLLVYFMHKIFPAVEFDFDNPLSIKRKRIRKAVIWVLGTIAVPVILSTIIG